MSSTDYAQVTTLIHRLGILADLLNPLTVIEVIVEVGRAVAVPPPGDPAGLLDLSDAFTAAGNNVARLVADVRSIADGTLPEIWKSDGGDRAARVVGATADLMSGAQPAFHTAANALLAYAGKVRVLQAEHARLRQELVHAALDPLTSVSIIAGIIAGCIALYRQSLDAADEIRGRLADVTGAARAAAAWRGGTPPARAVVLADTRIDAGSTGVDNGILSPAQLRRAGQIRAGLPADQREKLDALLARAGTDEERAYLLKALAAGHSVDELVAFDAQIHGRSDLVGRLSPINPNRPGDAGFSYVDANGNLHTVPIQQLDETTCGSTSILAARLMNDPIYALQFTAGSPTDPQEVQDRLLHEEQRIHHSTNLLWPEQLGTTPWGLSNELNQHTKELGTGYDWHLVDDTDPRSVDPAMRAAVSAADQGHPVPVMIGNAIPGHYILLVGHDGDDLVFYDPTGAVKRIPATDFLDGHLVDLGDGFQHVQAVVTPTRQR